MAIYSTFFLCKPKDLLTSFPGWRLPLPTPVLRQLRNPFTGQTSTIETQEPEWPDEVEVFDEDYEVVAIEGDYQDYLEGRLPAPVQACPHWAAKNLTEVELGPLAEALAEQPQFASPLYGPPSRGALLLELPAGIVARLASLDQQGLANIAESWAAKMSTREHTHSATGEELAGGWAANETMQVLPPIAALAKRAAPDERMYLLIEG